VYIYHSDVAVGAPFEDDYRGAVYIYNGFDDSFPKSWPYSQRIIPSDINLGIRAFGYSLSKSRVDVDDNLYGGIFRKHLYMYLLYILF
jgi:hypothetical protein